MLQDAAVGWYKVNIHAGIGSVFAGGGFGDGFHRGKVRKKGSTTNIIYLLPWEGRLRENAKWVTCQRATSREACGSEGTEVSAKTTVVVRKCWDNHWMEGGKSKVLRLKS